MHDARLFTAQARAWRFLRKFTRSRKRSFEREPAAEFYARLTESYGVDIDLEQIVRENRQPHSPIRLDD